MDYWNRIQSVAQIRLAAAAELEVVVVVVVVVGTTPLEPLVGLVVELELELLAVDEATLAVASNILPALLPVVLAVGMG